MTPPIKVHHPRNTCLLAGWGLLGTALQGLGGHRNQGLRPVPGQRGEGPSWAGPDLFLGWGLPRISRLTLRMSLQGRLQWKRGTRALSSTSSSPHTPLPPRTGEAWPLSESRLSARSSSPYLSPEVLSPIPEGAASGQGVMFFDASSGRHRSRKAACSLWLFFVATAFLLSLD